MKRRAILALLACLGSGAGSAQELPPTLALTPELDTPQAQEMLRHFEALCIDKYPDEAAVAQALEQMGAKPLPADMLNDLLRGGPGKGWLITSGNGGFAVTLKAAPDLHCAVSAAGLKLFAPDWRGFLGRMVSEKHQELSGNIDYDDLHPDGSVSHAFVNLVLSGPRLENYTLIVEEFPGPPSTSQAHVEARIMRRVLTPPAASTKKP